VEGSVVPKKLLFSLIPGRDLIFKATKGSGPGGQHQNKVESAVRLSHPASGVEIKVSDEKSQHRNKRIALHRLVANSKFKSWLRLHTAMVLDGYRSVEDKVKRMMASDNLKVEYITTFRCDNKKANCKASKKVVSTKQNPSAPTGWSCVEDMEGAYVHPKHFCPKCSKDL
jgi:hypothetical protein